MHRFLIARLATRNPQFGVLSHNAVLFFTSRTLSVSNTNHLKDGSLTASSFINSHWLSPKIALKLSKRLQSKNPDGPNAVVDLLRKYGFSDTQLLILVRKHPSLLLAKPETTLLPKLKFLRSIGASITDLHGILFRNPKILTCSLEKSIIPKYEIFRSLVRSDKAVISALKKGTWYISYMDDTNLNMEALRQLGVPQGSISLLVTNFPTVALVKHARFVEVIEIVKKMGFDPSKSKFIMAIQVLLKLNEAKWKSKLVVFEKWGWSRDICLLAFQRYPQCMLVSEKKIMKAMSFLINDMGCSPEDIARDPRMLVYCIEKTLIPRCAVVKILKARGLVKSDLRICSFITISEKRFLERYVTRFQKFVLLLVDAYIEAKEGTNRAS